MYGAEDAVIILERLAIKLDATAGLVDPDECGNAPVLYARMELMESSILTCAEEIRDLAEGLKPRQSAAR